MSALAGVEANSESRFVDYSRATSYEQFIADIGGVLRNWLHERPIVEALESPHTTQLLYEKTRFDVSFEICDPFVRGCKEPILEDCDIFHFFGPPMFVHLTLIDETWLTCSQADRQRAFSAVVCAVGETGFDLPVFFSATSSPIVWGYHLFLFEPQQALMRQPLRIIRNFSSVLYRGKVTEVDPLYYFDGLVALFDRDDRGIAPADGSHTVAPAHMNTHETRVSITEWFKYNQPSLAAHRASVAIRYGDGICSIAHDDIFRRSAALEAVRMEQDLESLHITRTHPIVLGTIESICSAFSDVYVRAIDIPPALLIRTCWKDISARGLVENAKYTKLVHSNLAVEGWSACASYGPQALAAITSSGRALALSRSLSRLLALYIIGKCAGKKTILGLATGKLHTAV
jgi:hypothetical protein